MWQRPEVQEVLRGRHSCLMPHTIWDTGHHPWIALLSIAFFVRRDELWGRFLTCGGLSIRLPHLYAPATALENRHHCLRLCRYVGQDCILRTGF
jgi:hypothetical protein